MPRLLILCFSDLDHDGRVLRQIDALRGVGELTAAGYTAPHVEGVRFVALQRHDLSLRAKLWQAVWMVLRRYEWFYWQQAHVRAAFARLAGMKFDVVVANDSEALPLGVRLAKHLGARLVYDAHEYTPRQFDHKWKWRLFLQGYKTWMCRTCMPQAQQCVAVNEPIAQEYLKHFGVTCDVSMNVSYWHDIAPRVTDAKRIRLVHHGLAFPGRDLEPMVRAMMLLDERFEATFVLKPGDVAYIEKLRGIAAGHPRIYFREPVSFDAIIPMLQEYDIGVFLLKPESFNQKYALPNKLFEYIQARLAVAVSPNPAMAELVRAEGCGVVAENYTPEALAASINALDAAKIDAFKQASHRAAAIYNNRAMHEKWRRWVLGA